MRMALSSCLYFLNLGLQVCTSRTDLNNLSFSPGFFLHDHLPSFSLLTISKAKSQSCSCLSLGNCLSSSRFLCLRISKQRPKLFYTKTYHVCSYETVSVRHHISNLLLRNASVGAGEVAQRLGALAALPEILSSIPSNHTVGSQASIMRFGTLF